MGKYTIVAKSANLCTNTYNLVISVVSQSGLTPIQKTTRKSYGGKKVFPRAKLTFEVLYLLPLVKD